MAPLIHNLSKDLILLTSGQPHFTPQQREALQKNNIPIDEREIAQIHHVNGHLKKIEFTSDAPFELTTLYAPVPFTQNIDIPGVYACGDCSSGMRSVSQAVASGTMAGAAINKELADLDFSGF